MQSLFKEGKSTEIIDGGKLLTLFRSVGINVRIQTTISVEQDGKMVSWSDKLKGQAKSISESVSESTSESISSDVPTNEKMSDNY